MPPGKDGSVSRGKRKQKKSPEPSTPREWRVPELYPPLPGPGEDVLDPLNALPPYPRREVPHSTQPEEGRTLSSPPHTRGETREGEEAPVSPAPPALLPLREAPPGPDAPDGAPPRLIYVPFSTSDLYNWKHQNPPFSEKPQELISLLETIFRTHQPTWDGCQTIYLRGKGKNL